jgi:sirohydrochlorin cobaltochelatase
VRTLLGVAHGSRDEASQEVVRRLLGVAADLRPGLQVAAAYLDNASPSVAAALAELAGDVTVLPLLLGAASHSKTDLAASVQAGRLAHPALTLRYARPLGPHPLVVQVLARRLTEAGAEGLPVLLVAGGSLDPDANASVAATARLLWEGRTYPSVDYAFVSATGPSVGLALERLRAQGSTRVALSRYFLGPGHLPRQAVAQAAAVEGMEVVVTEPLGVAPELAALVLERFDEALVGDTRMNCDACLYRIAFPGREAAVGAPQVPHSHPDDVSR